MTKMTNKPIKETHPSLINSKIEVSELSDELIKELINKIQKHTRDVAKIREAINKIREKLGKEHTGMRLFQTLLLKELELDAKREVTNFRLEDYENEKNNKRTRKGIYSYSI